VIKEYIVYILILITITITMILMGILLMRTELIWNRYVDLKGTISKEVNSKKESLKEANSKEVCLIAGEIYYCDELR